MLFLDVTQRATGFLSSEALGFHTRMHWQLSRAVGASAIVNPTSGNGSSSTSSRVPRLVGPVAIGPTVDVYTWMPGPASVDAACLAALVALRPRHAAGLVTDVAACMDVLAVTETVHVRALPLLLPRLHELHLNTRVCPTHTNTLFA